MILNIYLITIAMALLWLNFMWNVFNVMSSLSYWEYRRGMQGDVIKLYLWGTFVIITPIINMLFPIVLIVAYYTNKNSNSSINKDNRLPFKTMFFKNVKYTLLNTHSKYSSDLLYYR